MIIDRHPSDISRSIRIWRSKRQISSQTSWESAKKKWWGDCFYFSLVHSTASVLVGIEIDFMQARLLQKRRPPATESVITITIIAYWFFFFFPWRKTDFKNRPCKLQQRNYGSSLWKVTFLVMWCSSTLCQQTLDMNFRAR